MTPQQAFDHLIANRIVHDHQFARIEKWSGKEVLVLRLVTEPQNLDIQESIKCDLIHAESTGDTVNCNNYYYSNFRI